MKASQMKQSPVTSNHEYMSILWLCFVNGQAIGVWGEDGRLPWMN